ncbi:MAG: type I glyceraldehyde-3-phosphate dehydrogenase [Desulfobaccales bacterium]
MAKVAINGMGRIGRAAFKVILDTPELELVAVNDLMDLDNLAYLLKYDTVYGRYGKKVEIAEGALIVDGKKYLALSEKDPAQLPWSKLGVDVVFECTGFFTNNEGLTKHLQAGAKMVYLSAPPKGADVCTIVHGVTKPEGGANIVSCASCTTNCITPVVEVMMRRIGVKKAIMTTIHAYTSTQAIVDSPAKKWRRGRAGAANFVPTSTGAAKATTNCLPALKGKFDGLGVRGPVPSGSLADIVFVTARPTSVEEITRIFQEEAESPRYKGILGVAEAPLVSSDIIQDSRASIVDLEMTQVVDGDLVKILSWYDNEWGYTNQMIKEAVRRIKEAKL